MSVSRQVAIDLVRVYDNRLEQQIVQRGSSLACRDEELWNEVEGLLRDGDAKEKHCLGLDPLVVMEESLKAAASAPAATCSRRVKARGELHGLAKAFEVLEQAALNLYLGPWRKEYRVIKMYSGTFTHCITPVLSMPQIEKLFGLLGYQPSAAWPQQLCLQPPRVSPAFLDDLLRLSCAFFLARCECYLLLTALGKHVGDAQWELGVVRERRKGNSLQVALDNTKKTLEISQSAVEPPDREPDLYRDEPVNGGQEDLNEGGKSPDSQQGLSKAEPEADHSCTCLRSPVCLKHCLECNALHNITCAFLGSCEAEGHNVLFQDPPCLYPITFHECCDLSTPDPRVLCRGCRVFHSGSCKEGKLCQTNHDVSSLGECFCGKVCSRSPLVLCRYCGTEYCSNCWYKNPIMCTCGQTFDQSSSV